MCRMKEQGGCGPRGAETNTEAAEALEAETAAGNNNNNKRRAQCAKSAAGKTVNKTKI